MVVRIISGFPTRRYGALDSLFKAPPLAVAEQRLQVAGAPVFGGVLVGLLERLEGFPAKGRGLLFTHAALQECWLGNMPSATNIILIDPQAHQMRPHDAESSKSWIPDYPQFLNPAALDPNDLIESLAHLRKQSIR